MKNGFVQLSALNPAPPAALKADVERRRQAIVAGRFQPFSGRLVDNNGREWLADGVLADGQIAAMDWLVQGVTGSMSAAR